MVQNCLAFRIAFVHQVVVRSPLESAFVDDYFGVLAFFDLLKCTCMFKVLSQLLCVHEIMSQTYQVSRIGHESRAFECYLTLTCLPSSILCKSHVFQPAELEMGMVCQFTRAVHNLMS